MPVKPTQYAPSFIMAALRGSRPTKLTYSDVSGTNMLSTSSFYYDVQGSPLKSTQQLNVDWSQFENHTFFNSAEAKVNIAFDQIINGYPFDGTSIEIESFFEKLTGFDKWVFDQFPKYKGALKFSGSCITVNDFAGGLFPEISPASSTGKSVLNPGTGSMSIEMQLYVPAVANDNQIVCQKCVNDHGFSLHLSQSVSTSTCEIHFGVCSGTLSTVTSASLSKGRYSHVCAVFDRTVSNSVIIYVDEAEAARSNTQQFFDSFVIDETPFMIGSGSAVTFAPNTFTPQEYLSGTIDELRVFHSARNVNYQRAYAKKAITQTEDLKLYYKFNEPPPPLAPTLTDSVNSIVIDSSGNSLHAAVSNFTGSLRIETSADVDSPMTYEKDVMSPVLFPAHEDVVALNVELITSASEYDEANPNLITKLIPEHYLIDGMRYDGFDNVNGTLTTPYTSLSSTAIRGGKLGSTQLFLSLLYIVARFFDEMKLYIDAFSTVHFVDYDSHDTVPDNFLPALMKRIGFDLPTMFSDAGIEQYVDAENVMYDISTNLYPLKFVQNSLLRRLLTNIRTILLSKGTQHSIKAFLRTMGIDPDNSMRFREYGGPTERVISYARERKGEFGTMVRFTSSSLAISPFLSASRVEPGFPPISGSFVDVASHAPNGISNAPCDGYFTSGSWTYETIVKYTSEQVKHLTSTSQSFGRLCLTGTYGGFLACPTSVLANLVSYESGSTNTLTLYVRPGFDGTFTLAPLLTMTIEDVPILNGEQWHLSFGCVRNDATGSIVSSSYFLRAATQERGEITRCFTTSTFFDEIAPQFDTLMPTTMFNCFRYVPGDLASGTFIAVGSNQNIVGSDDNTAQFLNFAFDGDYTKIYGMITSFDGSMSNLRFWSKALGIDEWKEHVRNYKSAGVEDPTTHYNFVKTSDDSFERLRLDTFAKQDDRRATPASTVSGSVGGITFIDFSQNDMHMSGSGFAADGDCVKAEWFSYSYLSPYFDEASCDAKVRARSFQSLDNVIEAPWSSVAPVYEITKSEEPTDDARFAIEFSLIDAVNRDIVTLFSTLDEMNNAIGNPELLYSPDYPTLESLTEVYFNRLSSKLNFKAFFEFYRWFDSSIGTFITQLVPRKTKYKGMNFTIESHMLERHKLRYLSDGVYLGDDERERLDSVIQVQQLTSNARKY